MLVIVVPLAVGAFFAYRAVAGHFFPADYSGAGTGQVIVQIKPGDTATVVGDRLFALGVVASSRAFVNAAEASPKASSLQPGFYRLHKHMSATTAFNLLLNPSARIQHLVTIPEGLRVPDILAALGHGSGIPLADYKQALRSTAALGLPSYARGNPEGYLFPATYPIQPHMTATGVLQGMVKSFDAEAASVGLTQAAASVHLTPGQVIVVASLAQAEGGKILGLRQDHPGDLQPAARRDEAPAGQHGALRPARLRHPRLEPSSCRSTRRTTPTSTRGCRRARSTARETRRSAPRCTRRAATGCTSSP